VSGQTAWSDHDRTNADETSYSGHLVAGGSWKVKALTTQQTRVGSSAEGARYAQVAARLREAIEGGQYKIDDTLPTEAQLSEQFSISRHTAREALRLLTNAGLIVRRQGSGSRVIASSPVLRYVVVLQDEAEVLQYAEPTIAVYKRSRRPTSARALRAVGVDEPARQWATLSGSRKMKRSGQRLAVSTVYIREAYAKAFSPDETSPVVFPRIIAEFGIRINYIDQEISATTLAPRVALQLGREPGEPAIKVLRRFVGHEVGLFEVSATIHPADLYTHLTRLIRFYPDESNPAPE
jgi:GntR family transcriptional regulator